MPSQYMPTQKNGHLCHTSFNIKPGTTQNNNLPNTFICYPCMISSVFEEYLTIILGCVSPVLLRKHFMGTHQKCLGEALLTSTHSIFLWRNKIKYH